MVILPTAAVTAVASYIVFVTATFWWYGAYNVAQGGALVDVAAYTLGGAVAPAVSALAWFTARCMGATMAARCWYSAFFGVAFAIPLYVVRAFLSAGF